MKGLRSEKSETIDTKKGEFNSPKFSETALINVRCLKVHMGSRYSVTDQNKNNILTFEQMKSGPLKVLYTFVQRQYYGNPFISKKN